LLIAIFLIEQPDARPETRSATNTIREVSIERHSLNNKFIPFDKGGLAALFHHIHHSAADEPFFSRLISLLSRESAHLYLVIAQLVGISDAVRNSPYGIQQPAVSGQIIQEKPTGVGTGPVEAR
jgi:hypothetical protein